MRRFVIDGLHLVIDDQTYLPAEDTFLILDHLEMKGDEDVLDLGTGCGILAIIAAQKAKKVVAVDVNPYAVICAKTNINIQNLGDKVEVRYGDLFNTLRPKEKFDLIIFNPPYLPEEISPREEWLSKAWAGGPKGTEITESFLSKVKSYLKKNGRILFIQSSLSRNKPLSGLKKCGLSGIIKDTKRFDFETLFLIEATQL